MKKNYLPIILFFTILFLAACKKETKEINARTGLQNKVAQNRPGNSCRLIHTHSEYGDYSYTYNERGLLDEWDVPPYGGYFKQEYDETGRLTKSRLYSGNALIYTIVFFYERKNVVKEIWYNGDTKEKGDEVFYTHNPKGLILTTRSFILDYYVTNKFTSTGNLSEWTLYSDGQPVVTGRYTYLNHYKNSDRAIPGLEYGFPFANGAYNQNKWYSTSEDIILYDEKGKPFLDADQDPSKTIAEVGHQNYVTASDFYDVLNQQWIHFRFTYDNCGSANNLTEASSSKLSPPNIDKRKRILQKLLVHRSAKYIKEQIKELRKEIKK